MRGVWHKSKSTSVRHVSNSKLKLENTRKAKKKKVGPLSAIELLTSRRGAPNLSKPVLERNFRWLKAITGLNMSKTSITISIGTTLNLSIKRSLAKSN